MARKSKEINTNGYDLTELQPYKEECQELKAAVKAANQAVADFYAKMKGDGYPKELIADFKRAMKIDEIGLDVYEEGETRLLEMCRALNIGRNHEQTY